MLLVAVVCVPLAAGAIAGSLRWRPAVGWAMVLADTAVLGLGIALAVRTDGHHAIGGLDGALRADALSAFMVVVIGAIAVLASLQSIRYLDVELARGERHPRQASLYGLLVQVFVACMLAAVLAANLGALWVAVEATTIATTFLVGHRRTDKALEASWKYVLICSVGIALAFLGTVLVYFAALHVPGHPSGASVLDWTALVHDSHRLDPGVVRLAMALLVLGYGTKVGLAPMHTWLPDAHSEGPAPVSAMLSGALLNAAMIGIVRFIGIIERADLGALPGTIIVAIGTLSLAIAALFITRQRDIKRLMAYSSIEHMGIITLGFGFGGPLGVAGALYQMLNHSLNKSLMFFGAGDAMHAFHSKRIGRMQHVLVAMPIAGALWLAGAIAITGAPPFGLFLSEFTILRAGLAGPNAWAVYVMLALLIVIFIGFLNHFRIMYFGHSSATAATVRWQPAPAERLWCVLPMWLAIVPLLILGLWWPQACSHYFAVIAAQLASATR
jgi:hydrogenase-4 component F